jgi:hypothetical protein
VGTDYILVDYENVQPQDVPRLDPARCRMTIFRGAHQKTIDATLAETLQPLGRSVDYVRVEKHGRNALDFQLAFHAGRLIERHEASNPGTKARFLIVSNDSGFDALLVHIQALGHVAVKSPSIRDGLQLAVPAAAKVQPDALDRALQHLRKNVKNRPATRDALLRHLSTHFHGTPEVHVEQLVATLEQTGVIAVAGKKVTYLKLDP